MSAYTLPNPLPAGKEPTGTARIPAALPSLGFAAALGLLVFLPEQARADDYSYGHAEITLGFPNGQVSLGRTWDDGPREVVVEKVTHKLPETDFDDEVGDGDEGAAYEEDEADEQVIIEKRRRARPVKKVTIIERYVEEPAECEQVNVVHRYYVPRSHSHSEVVVYRPAPRRVVYVPSRHVVVHKSHGRGYGHNVHVVGHGRGHGSRSLFPAEGGRQVRSRGVQRQMVSVGSHHH
jgi:hypothetical protein